MIVDPVVVFDVTVSRPVDLSDQAPGFLSGAAVGRSRTAPEVPAGSYRMAAAAPAGCGEALVMVADEVLIAGLWEWPPTTTVVGRVRYDKV
ncbi:hypothetical protein HQ535_15615 [bacterium]|nr:hypothetical protein [bacterium]